MPVYVYTRDNVISHHLSTLTTNLVGRCPDIDAFAVFSGGVVAELEVEQAAVLDGVVGYVGVYHEVLKTNALPPATRCGAVTASTHSFQVGTNERGGERKCSDPFIEQTFYTSARSSIPPA